MMSKNLELLINQAIRHANQKRHEYLTLESVLLEMVRDDDQVASVLAECGANPDAIKDELENFIVKYFFNPNRG